VSYETAAKPQASCPTATATHHNRYTRDGRLSSAHSQHVTVSLSFNTTPVLPYQPNKHTCSMGWSRRLRRPCLCLTRTNILVRGSRTVIFELLHQDVAICGRRDCRRFPQHLWEALGKPDSKKRKRMALGCCRGPPSSLAPVWSHARSIPAQRTQAACALVPATEPNA